MMNKGEISVRRAIADGTAEVHEALHHHAHIARLAAHNLQRDEYVAMLVSYLAFYTAVEEARLQTGGFDTLGLAPTIATLRQDIADLKEPLRVEPPSLNIPTRKAVLGALYVLHGAGFGGRTLATTVRRVLPDVPCRYLSAGTDKGLWRDLTAELEKYQDDPKGTAQIIAAANETFHIFGAFVTKSCTALAEPSPHAASGVA